MRRTSSRLTGGTISNSTARVASRRRLQRAWPSGAGEQARAIRRASSANASFGVLPGWGRPCKATVKPSVAKRSRTRATVRALTAQRSATWASVRTGRRGAP